MGYPTITLVTYCATPQETEIKNPPTAGLYTLLAMDEQDKDEVSGMRTKEEILAMLKEELPNLRVEYGVDTLAVFGSYSRGEQREDSDVDILVEFVETVDFIEFMRLEFHLTDVLGIKVDLVTPDALRPLMRDDIMESAVYA
jgi:predicted nucleotidyltransferase